MRYAFTNLITFLIDFFFLVISFLLIARVILRLFAANQDAPFVRWIYEVTMPLLYPFRGIFPSPAATGGYVLELPTIFALILYALAGYLIVGLIHFIAKSLLD